MSKTKSFKPLKDLPEKLDVETQLKDYILVDETEWSTLQKNIHIRYKTMDGDMRSGFIQKIEAHETPEAKWYVITLKNALYVKNGKPIYWSIKTVDIANIWKKNITITPVSGVDAQPIETYVSPDLEKINISLDTQKKMIENLKTQVESLTTRLDDMETNFTKLVDKLTTQRKKI